MLLQKNLKVAIVGASGYTGVELVRLLLKHPNVTITQLVAHSNADKSYDELYTHLRGQELPKLSSLDDAPLDKCDIAFFCLPHTKSQSIIKNINSSLKVIDLSADFRLENPAIYEQWYQTKHLAPELQPTAIYGLSELNRDRIKTARLVACPGCYPTSMILPLAPLCRAKLIHVDDIIIDAKSGATGAGRSANVGTLFCEVNDNLKAYNICKHRHIPETEQALSKQYGDDVTINFTPHLVPMSRGILSTIYVTLNDGITTESIHQSLHKAYKNEPFVDVLPVGVTPTTRDVTGTNKCLIGVTPGRSTHKAVIVSAIDNLIKGAAGQAIQNMNIMSGLKEHTGLELLPQFP